VAKNISKVDMRGAVLDWIERQRHRREGDAPKVRDVL
jgi:hypothetical protein